MYLLLIFCPLFACWVICVTSSNNLINTRTAQQHNQFAFCHVDLAKTERLVTNLPGLPLDSLHFPHGCTVTTDLESLSICCIRWLKESTPQAK